MFSLTNIYIHMLGGWGWGLSMGCVAIRPTGLSFKYRAGQGMGAFDGLCLDLGSVINGNI